MISSIPKWHAAKAFTLHNAHQDDIHGMIPRSSGFLISGSKDGALKKWTFAGDLEREIISPLGKNYCHWITALAPAGEEHWISGTRDGQLTLWDNSGDRVADLAQDSLQNVPTHHSKERNALRINCLTTCSTAPLDITYFVGQPTQCSIHRFNTEGDRFVDHVQTSHNDWVFAIHVLALNRLLIATGDRLEIWHRPAGKRWRKEETLIQPSEDLPKGHSRAFISGITLLEEKPSLYGAAIFGGTVSGIDLSTSQEVFHTQEHKGRVWMIENIASDIFASCSDDRTIKLWDLRQTQHSQKTLKGHIGRVSSLLRLDPYTLVAGTCPDNLRTATEGAQLVFWDLRNC